MRKQASALENEMHQLVWDFDIITDHLISAKRPDLLIIDKRRELSEFWTLQFRLTTE